MESIKKQEICNRLRAYCERYDSRNKAAASLDNVSSATLSQMLNGNWELIKDDMWRNVASQIGYRESRWQAAETACYKELWHILSDVKENALVMAVTGEAGSGKSFALKGYRDANRQVYLLTCNEYWNRKLFLAELLSAMGRTYTGYTVGEMMAEIVRCLKRQEAPLLIFDEVDKLSDRVLYFFITLYNQLEDECGILLCATNHLEKRLRAGVRQNKKGYNEIWSRIGRRCVPLEGVSAADIAAICELNGVSSPRTVDRIIADSEGDLRRVKRRVHAESGKANGK